MRLSGERIGRYVRLDPIGRGAMGVVYRAEDPLIHRTVAVKVLHPARGLAPDQLFIVRERFRREAQAAGNIDHPHIVRIFDVGEQEGSNELFIVMEYLSGGSLEERIAEGSLGVDLSMAIIGQIASALDAAHEREIVHRDVKPSNILFTERGAAKIVDFGITQIASSSLTQDLSQLGTPAYMSPEQVAGRPLDARADLFSLGILSYEILTGTKPFTGGDVVAIAHAIAHADPAPISRANPELPASLDRVFALMLAKNPADRFTSGTAFHQALVRCLAEDDGSRASSRAARASGRSSMLWPIAGAALLAAVMTLAWHSGREESPIASAPAAPVVATPPPAPIATKPPAPVAAKAPALVAAKPPAPVAAKAPAPVAAKAPAPAPKPPAAATKTVAAANPPSVVATTTISLTHRIKQGRLVVAVDGARILNEEFSKSRLAISQTTVWDPVPVASGTHSLRAKVVSDDGTTYFSEPCKIEFPRATATAIRIKMKGDRLLVQPG